MASKKRKTDKERGWYVKYKYGMTVSFGFITSQLMRAPKLSDITESRGWKENEISDEEKERVRKLFDENGELIRD